MNLNQKRPDPKLLRCGFSTGAYAAATALSAWRCLRGKPLHKKLPLWFADGQVRTINVNGAKLKSEGNAEAWAIKDAGDDIDITHQAVIRAKVEFPGRGDIRPEDFSEPCGKATLIIRGAKGIGLARRPGLDVPPGKWAINPVPRVMIAENLRRDGAGNHPGCFSIEFSIDNGEELARHTLNPVLGIEGGLSVLGTTGLVIPCSHAAYVETIRVLIRGASASGAGKIALVTGGKTHGAIRKLFPDIPEHACIRFGDFIYETLLICEKHKIERVVIACMVGKLAKYALGHTNTHAHQAAQDVSEILLFLQKHGYSPVDASRNHSFRSFRECLETLSESQQKLVIAILKKEAEHTFHKWAPSLKTEILVFNPQGKLFFEGASA